MLWFRNSRSIQNDVSVGKYALGAKTDILKCLFLRLLYPAYVRFVLMLVAYWDFGISDCSAEQVAGCYIFFRWLAFSVKIFVFVAFDALGFCELDHFPMTTVY